MRLPSLDYTVDGGWSRTGYEHTPVIYTQPAFPPEPLLILPLFINADIFSPRNRNKKVLKILMNIIYSTYNISKLKQNFRP
jgi:hypothetical protein